MSKLKPFALVCEGQLNFDVTSVGAIT